MTARTTQLLQRLVQTYTEILMDNLVGIYLHGSYVLGAYNERVSDLDYIVVVRRPLDLPTKQALMTVTLNDLWSLAPAKGLEWHVLLLADTQHFHHPCPFDFHFSKMHLDRYKADPAAYVQTMHGTDPDLATHLTIMHASGQVLCGPAINDVFAPVPAAIYWQGLLFDVVDAPTMMCTQPMYTTLNLCRVLAYQREHLILSKADGGIWGLAHVPQQYRPLVKQALDDYQDQPGSRYLMTQTQPFAQWALAQLNVG